MGSAPPAPRPPVALGCTAIAAVAVIVVVVVIAGASFLESGSNGGLLLLDEADSYAPGSVTFVGAQNLYAIALPDGTFLALADLDAANRANPGRRCRVAPIPSDDPTLPDLLSRYGPRFSPTAAGSTLLFRETCNNAIYDFIGTPLDADGRNLDRYAVDVRQGRLAVNLAARTCARREGPTLSLKAAC